MKKKTTMKKTHLVIEIFITLLLLCGVVIIAIAPLPDRNLTLKLIDEAGVITYVDISHEAISKNIKQDENCELLPIEINLDANEKNICKISINSTLKSVSLGNINYWDFANCINWDTFLGGEIIWNDASVTIRQPNQLSFCMTDEFRKILKPYCTTRLLERFVMAGAWLALCIFLYIVNNSITYRDEKYNHSPIKEIKKFCTDLKRYKQYTIYSAKADLKAEVANSYLNRLWWLLQPFFNMIVYVIVFGTVMGSGISYYAAFIFSSLLMWDFFSKTINYSVQLVRNNREIVSHVYVPKSVILLSNMMLNMYKLLFSLIVLVPLMLMYRVPIGIEILYVIPCYLLMFLFSFGLGMILLHYGVYVDDLSYAVGILLSMLMFLSGVFYDVLTTLPSILGTIMMCLNPVAIFVDSMRNALLYQTITNVPQILLWIALSVLLGYIGIHIVYKNENGYVKVV